MGRWHSFELGRIARQTPPILICCAAVLNGCGKKPPPPTPPAQVQVMTVEPRDTPIYKEWIGTLEGLVNATIHAQVVGYLLRQDYEEGKPVKKGDLLFEIDPRPFQAALDQAKAKLAQDEAEQSRTAWDVERYAPLAKKSAISEQEYNNAVQANLAAKAQVKASGAAVEAAQVNIGFTKVNSPIDGLAGIAQAQIGDLVGPNGPVLTTVSTIDPIRVFFTTSEQAYLTYRRQYTNVTERATHEQELELQLILADGSIYPRLGKFVYAGREINPTTGTIQLVGYFPNPENVLRPGQFARVRAQTQIRKDALIVPQRAVSELQGSYQIALVQDQNGTNVAHIQPVTPGDRVGSDWIIEKGVKPGDRVIVEGAQKVQNGKPVVPKPFAAAQSPAPTGKPND